MDVSFISDLYGVKDNDPTNPFGSDNCSPSWDSISTMWTVTTTLGDCAHVIGVETDAQNKE